MATARSEALSRAVAARVAARRRELGWSQERLADAADLHRTFLGRFESGERGISLAAAAALADALGVTFSALVAEAEQELSRSG